MNLSSSFLRSATLFIAGTLISLTIVLGIIACAIWHFPDHLTIDNSFFAVVLITSVASNLFVAACLLIGVQQNRACLFMPFIINAIVSTIVNITGAIILTYLSIATKTFDHNNIINLLIGAVMCALFALISIASLHIVVRYRQNVIKESGQHYPLQNEDV